MSKKQELARELARHANNDMGQIRKGSGAPYWVHTQGVADILEGYGCEDEAILIVAELHDTCEDTELPLETIEEMFGSKIAELVTEVTNSPDLDGMKKEDYMNKKIANLSSNALTVKLGDMLYNCSDSPKREQIDRMRNNIEFLCRHRKLTDIQKELIAAYEASYEMKVRGGLRVVGK